MFSTKAPENKVALLRDDADSLQSQVIDWLRFPLAVAVVFIHTSGTPPIDDVSLLHADPFSAMNLYNWLRICLSHTLTAIAVPTFFVISGFLLFRKWQCWDKQLYVKKMKSRFRTLVVPYLCWNAIAILLIVGLKIGAFLVKGKPLSNIPLFFEENGFLRLFWCNNVWSEHRINWLGMSTPMSGPIDLPLWFLRDLIVVTALTPLFYWFFKKTRFYGLMLLGLLYVSGIWPVIPGLTVTAAFFFGMGACLAIYGKNLVTEFRRVRILSYVLAVLLLLPLMWFDGSNTLIGQRIYPFYVIAGVVAVFNLAADLLERGKTRVVPLLSHSTFFIYAVHTQLVLHVSHKVFSPLWNLGYPLTSAIAYLLTPLLAVSICVVMFLLMKRWLPRVLGVLTGNRY